MMNGLGNVLYVLRCWQQGDQIGKIFGYSATVYYRQFSVNYNSSAILLTIFLRLKNYALILIKMSLSTFWRFFWQIPLVTLAGRWERISLLVLCRVISIWSSKTDTSSIPIFHCRVGMSQFRLFQARARFCLTIHSCQIFLRTKYQNVENIQNNQQKYKTAISKIHKKDMKIPQCN
jgi:hypothetical protein